ncbi:hypothetical protein ES702_00270 [subsurface metagenome]
MFGRTFEARRPERTRRGEGWEEGGKEMWGDSRRRPERQRGEVGEKGVDGVMEDGGGGVLVNV